MAIACTKCDSNGINCPYKADFLDPLTLGIQFSNSPKMRFDEPEQGIWGDCWFVAALSSYLFIRLESPPQPVDGKYKFLFNNGKKAVYITTSGKVCMYGNVIIGAKENDGGTIYSWPAVYEKAYAAFLENNKKELNPPDPPDMKKYIDHTGNPMTCLQILSGWSDTTIFTESKTASQIFNSILNLSEPAIGSSYQATVPIVAWTYWYYIDSRMQELGINISHSYSILGVLDVSDIGRCIILRDPKVADCKAYNEKNEKQNIIWTYIDKATVNLPLVPVPCDSNGKGIFAITEADFKNYFEAFGYVG